ncbi:MAG: PKD domain-containing protein, partial [Actinomycetota bacterium]|nr:PKD domain-containing protein [Actinomycetota bacterium]
MGSTVPSQRPERFRAVRRWPRRGALAAAITLTALATSSATARAAGFVQIVGAGGPQTVDLGQLKPNVFDHTYTLIAPPLGAPGTVTVTSGYSLPMILKHLTTPSTSFQSVEIPAPQGPTIVLSNAQATSPGAYSFGGPPVVWADGAGTHVLVPSTPGGGITGSGETFTGAITLKLHRGPALAVGISGRRAIIGKPVQFDSTVGGAPAGPIVYQWSFGDGALSSQADPSHTYAATATYNVYLQVTGSEDSVGASSVIHVVVGNPPPRPRGPGTGTAGNGSGTAGRPGGSGGDAGTGTGAGSPSTTTTPAGTATTPARRAPAKRSKRHR